MITRAQLTGLGQAGTLKVVHELSLAVLLGGVGFALNFWEAQLGWGMHFIFGNAFVFAFLRILRPATLITAVSFASLRSILLWNHPWAWAVWTLEAAVLAFASRRSSPIRTDVLFWAGLGAPLLILTYGGVMGMDRLSLLLVIAKQAVNGVLNVALGEIVYSVMLMFAARISSFHWKRLHADSIIMMILMSIVLVPTTVYLGIEAPKREFSARAAAEQSLENFMFITGWSFDAWLQSRQTTLSAFAYQQEHGQPAGDAGERTKILAEFDRVESFTTDGRRLWAIGGTTKNGSINASALGQKLREVQAPTLTACGLAGRSDKNCLDFIVPFTHGGERAFIVATIRPSFLPQIFGVHSSSKVDGVFLFVPGGRGITIMTNSSFMEKRVRQLPNSLHAAAARDTILVSPSGYGSSLMSDLKGALIVRARSIPSLPDWQIMGVMQLSGEVLKAREEQMHLFMTLCLFIILVTLISSALSRWVTLILRQIAQSAADLALTGTRGDQIDRLVISELDDISVNLGIAGSQVAKERGALVSYQRRLRSISQHAPVVVYALDVAWQDRGRVLYISEALEKIFGYSVEAAFEPGWWLHNIHPDDVDRYEQMLLDLQPGQSVSIEYRLRHKQGHFVWVLDNLAVELDLYFGKSEVVGLIMDITDRKIATAQLVQADKMASLGRMVAGVAHELNQPLNFIKLASINLKQRTDRGLFDAESFNAKLENILAQVKRASAIILQMRVFGRMPVEPPGELDLAVSIQAVLTMVGPQIEADGIKIELEGHPTPLFILAHPVLIEQVLLNVLLNASDAIRARESLKGEIAIANAEPGCIRITVRPEGKYAVITIEDNGTGISEEDLPILFEPFFTTKPPKQGTGLGLSISYGIVRDFGGEILAKNIRNGACFTIRLPLVQSRARVSITPHELSYRDDRP